MNVSAPHSDLNVLKLSDDKRVAGLAVVGPNAKSHDVCYLVAIGGKAEAAYNLPAVLLREKSICDNQSHYARENQQCREGFSDHWPRRMARSR